MTSTREKPIRVDYDTWLVMRTDPVPPKALIRRVRDRKNVDIYLLLKWDLDPAKQVLMGSYETLERANAMVLYDNPKPNVPSGQAAFGPYGDPTIEHRGK